MKGKYITKQLMLVFLSNRHNTKKDIHAALRETISQRKEIIKQMENLSRKAELLNLYLNHSNAA